VKSKELILITVTTYPNPSKTYGETVCTAGITNNGDWRRLYPVELRYLDPSKRYRTYDVIEVEVDDRTDGRPETRRPNCSSIKIIRHLESWEVRAEWIDKTIFKSLKEMKDVKRSIGPVAVKKILKFYVDKTESEWSQEKQQIFLQGNLFGDRKPLEKIPYNFRFNWIDEGDEEHDSMILSWEMNETWRKYRQKYSDPIEVMRDKWINDICGPKRKVSFFMGNSREHPQNFMICGIFGPPKDIYKNASLF
jgi:hypothetical protein